MTLVEVWEVTDKLYDHITFDLAMNPRDCYGRLIFAVIQGCVGSDNSDSMGLKARHEFDNPPASKRGFGKNETFRLCDKVANSFTEDIQSEEPDEEDDRAHLCVMAGDIVFAFFESYKRAILKGATSNPPW